MRDAVVLVALVVVSVVCGSGGAAAEYLFPPAFVSVPLLDNTQSLMAKLNFDSRGVHITLDFLPLHTDTQIPFSHPGDVCAHDTRNGLVWYSTFRGIEGAWVNGSSAPRIQVQGLRNDLNVPFFNGTNLFAFSPRKGELYEIRDDLATWRLLMTYPTSTRDPACADADRFYLMSNLSFIDEYNYQSQTVRRFRNDAGVTALRWDRAGRRLYGLANMNLYTFDPVTLNPIKLAPLTPEIHIGYRWLTVSNGQALFTDQLSFKVIDTATGASQWGAAGMYKTSFTAFCLQA